MSRGLWFVAGAGVGIYGMIRARRAAESLTVDGLRDRVGAAVVGARMFRDEVAQGRADAESELRERLGLVPQGRPELERGSGEGFRDGRGAPSSTTTAAPVSTSTGAPASTSTGAPASTTTAAPASASTGAPASTSTREDS